MGIELFSLEGKSAIVTGSGRGLGRAIARGLAECGAAVVVGDRDEGVAEASAASIREAGARALATRLDTTDRASCERLVEFAKTSFGSVDVLVNNAGIDIIKPAEDMDGESWAKVVDVNLAGYFNCAQCAAREMLAQGGGSIVNNSSIASLVGIPGLVAYSAAKAGVNQLTRVMAVEWATRGVRVNAFAPGYFENIMRDAGAEHGRAEKQEQIERFTPMGRRGRPEELIGPVAFLASEASSYVTGAILTVDGGYTAL
jgi:NAD(P)-dependent dehydrogenase (short-subunit alcohol dehydrogenase family)